MDSSALFDEILSNILGILPPIIIFNFIYEYLSKEYVADEMSEKMMETLVGNPQMMETFKEDVRQNFINATIKSLVGDEQAEMVVGVLSPYIKNKPYDMKIDYKYLIDLIPCHEQREFGCDYFAPSEYYIVKEDFSFTKVLSDSTPKVSKFSVGFFVDAAVLEKELLEKNYIFRESLKLHAEDLQKLINTPREKWNDFVSKCLHLQLFINGSPLAIESVDIGDFGITVDFHPNGELPDNHFDVEIAFRMPQLKKRSEFLVLLPEPSLSPEIRFTYDPDITKVTAYQFLNDDSKLIKDAAAVRGRINIRPIGWVYPVKGVLFIIEDADDTNASMM